MDNVRDSFASENLNQNNVEIGRDTFGNFDGQKTGIEMEDDFNCRQ
jgi:hypothetical protein